MTHVPSSNLSKVFHNFIIVSLISLGFLSSLIAQKGINFDHRDISMKSALILLVEQNDISIIFSVVFAASISSAT